MNGSFSVHPGSLRQGGESFALAADRLDEAVHRLRRALASSGEPWGHDRPGDRFGAGYRCSAEGTLAYLASLPVALDKVAKGLHANADQFEAADLASAVEP